MDFNPFSVAVAAVVCAAVMAIGVPIAKAYARRIEERREGGPSSSELEARLARIEQSLESIAVEIERVSEGQRFTTKLLSEGGRGAGRGEAPKP